MIRRSIRHVVTALVLLVAFVCQGTWALAGTTGGLSGSVVDAESAAPVAGAQVTASSPSQNATGTTDAAGHFTFLTLPPDTYTLTIAKSGYQQISVPGQVVFADTVQTLTVRLPKALKTIAHVSATGVGTLVKSGTTADVYSVNAGMQQAASALGGGGGLNSAYSAVASVPGAYVPANQTGYFQTVAIRGGDYDQVGYEFDGVPVNRSFDNYPSSSASSLGNAEVQVYTGASPANSESQGLSGYINQVIKTGTYPGYANAQLGIGTPTFYHRAMVEAGGSTPDRLFSYYVGVAGYNQAFNYLDNQNGASLDNWVGAPLSLAPNISYAPTINYLVGSPAPWYYYMGPFNYSFQSGISARDVVVNFHVGIPHRFDAGRDDVQLLWDSESLLNTFYSTTNDITSTSGCGSWATTGALCAGGDGTAQHPGIGLGVPFYVDSVTWACQGAVGKTFSAIQLNAQAGCVQPYFFPSSQNRTAPNEPIPANASDNTQNNQEIVKLQYTKNFGSTSFLRLYGYTYYSDWMQKGPQTTYADFTGCCSPDYDLMSHTRGISLSYQNQFNAQNLVSAQASYVTANSIRDNNHFYQVGGFTAASVVSSANPTGGLCYALPPSTGSGGPLGAVQCNGNGLKFGSIGAAPNLTGYTCGGAPCTYFLDENGLSATYNQVIPKFFSASLTDEFRPSDKWLFNLGVRLDSFTFQGQNTDTNDARVFWTNAFNQDYCINQISGKPVSKGAIGTGVPVTAACPTGYSAANWQNTPANFTYNIYQPRISGTYTVNPENVVRFSYGRYAEAPNSAFEQYNTSQENLAAYDAANFYAFGRTSPGYPVRPSTSINYDISWEHHFKGTAMSMKLTPFLRQTQDQIQNFFLDQKTGFISGLNAGDQRSQGVEFQFQDGDFSRNGFAGQVSFAYTNSYIHYGSLASGLYGTSVIAGTNEAISAYNAFTSACRPGGPWVGKIGPNHVPLCGVATNGSNSTVAAAPCYTTSGAPVYTCTAADIGNPYWNNPQPLIDPGTAFPTFDIFPGGIGSGGAAYGVPYAASLVLNYKHDKWAVTPTLSFAAGGKYGIPQTNPGINPAACSAVLPGVSGFNGGGRYDALSCPAALAAVPDTYTGVFDPLGSFTQPNLLAMNLQLSYDVSPRLSLTGVLANILNTCWGGTTAPWTSSNHNVCAYAVTPQGGYGGEIFPVGNIYNPPGHNGSLIQPLVKYPYFPIFGAYNQDSLTGSEKFPFQFYVTANIKI